MSVREPTDREVQQAAQKALKSAKTPLEILRAECLKRGSKGIRGLGRTFRIMDDDSNKRLTKQELTNGLNDYGIKLTPTQIEEIFATIDRDGSGSIDFDEFLRALRPPMTSNRESLVAKAFAKLDKSGDGIVTSDDLKGVYNVRGHPKYVNGDWTEKQCFENYLNNFEINSKTKDGKITKSEFLDYYAGISASIDEDPYFDLMMRSVWKL